MKNVSPTTISTTVSPSGEKTRPSVACKLKSSATQFFASRIEEYDPGAAKEALSVCPPSSEHRPSEAATPRSVDARKCWQLLPLLAILGSHFTHEQDVQVSLLFLVLPVAAWIGARYQQLGFKVVVVGLLPLWIGTPNMGGFSLTLAPACYFAALVVCWAFAHPDRWWRAVMRCTPSLPFAIALFVLAGFSLRLTSGWGQVGWQGSAAIALVGAFCMGVGGKGTRSAAIAAILILIVGYAFSALRGSSLPLDDFGGGLRYQGGFYLINAADVLAVALMLWLGHRVGTSLQCKQPLTIGLRPLTYVLFYALWLAATHTTTLTLHAQSGEPARLSVFGSDWLMLSLAFFAGTVWGRRGVIMLTSAICLSVLESFVSMELDTMPTWSFGGISLSFALAQLSHDLWIFGVSYVYWFLGRRVVETDEGLQSPRIAGGNTAIAPLIVPWLFVPIIAILSYQQAFTKHFAFRLELLAVPLAAWLALCFGRNGFLAFAIGGLSYLVGFNSPVQGFSLRPDLYFSGVLVAWAIAYPERAWQQLRSLHPSWGACIALLGLLSVNATLRHDELELGLPTNHLYPLVVFVLGWAGTPVRQVLFPMMAFAVLGIFVPPMLKWLGGLPAAISINYWPSSLGGLAHVACWYLAGVTLHRATNCADTPLARSPKQSRPAEEASDAILRWAASECGYLFWGRSCRSACAL